MLETFEQFKLDDPTALTPKQKAAKWTFAGVASVLLVALFYLVSLP